MKRAGLASLNEKLKQAAGNVIRSEKRAIDFVARLNHVLEDEEATISKVVHAMLGQRSNAVKLDMSWLNKKQAS